MVFRMSLNITMGPIPPLAGRPSPAIGGGYSNQNYYLSFVKKAGPTRLELHRPFRLHCRDVLTKVPIYFLSKKAGPTRLELHRPFRLHCRDVLTKVSIYFLSKKAGPTRLELATSGLTGRRSNQTELRPRKSVNSS